MIDILLFQVMVVGGGGGGETKRHTHIATYRLNQPTGLKYFMSPKLFQNTSKQNHLGKIKVLLQDNLDNHFDIITLSYFVRRL